MNKIDFTSSLGPAIIEIGKYLFDTITRIPQDIRKDDKERTGIQIYIAEASTRNLAYVSVYNPSPVAMTLAVSKPVIAELEGHTSSANTANPDIMKFPGGIIYIHKGQKILVGVSGLQGNEDTAVAIITLSQLIRVPVSKIINQITTRLGIIPDNDKNHYIGKLYRQHENMYKA